MLPLTAFLRKYSVIENPGMSNILLTLLILLRFGGTAIAAVPPDSVSVSIHVSNEKPTIGDSLTVFCSVFVPSGIDVREPRLVDDVSGTDIERQWFRQENDASGNRIDQYGYLIYALSPDTLSVGPFMVDFSKKSGESATSASNIVVLPVNGVITPSPDGQPPEPAENRPPIAINRTGLPVWALILIVIIVIGTAVGIWYYLRRKKRTAAPLPVPAGPVDELAEFERIRSMHLYEKGEIRELYIAVSDAMRSFLHRTMRFGALYETSEEILGNISGPFVTTDTYDKIRDVFVESDMVKFAKYRPSVEESASLIDRAVLPVKSILDEIEREKRRRAAEALEKAKSTPHDGNPVSDGDVTTGVR